MYRRRVITKVGMALLLAAIVVLGIISGIIPGTPTLISDSSSIYQAQKLSRVSPELSLSPNLPVAFAVEPDELGLKQQDIRNIEVAFGRGSLHYLETPGEMFILGGQAYLEGPDGELRSSNVLVNTEYALGLEQNAAPSALLYLAKGTPVSLESLLADIGQRWDGPMAVMGVGIIPGTPTLISDNFGDTLDNSGDTLLNFWAWEIKVGVAGIIKGVPEIIPKLYQKLWPAKLRQGFVFLAFRTDEAGVQTDTSDGWRVRGMRTARLPEAGLPETPAKVLARAQAAEPWVLQPDMGRYTAVELALVVYELNAVVPAADFIEPPLVEINVLDPDIRLDIRYAGPNNFAGRPVYSAPRAYLALPEAQRLARVNAWLREQGLALKVYDAYRPFSDHARLWALAPNKEFWADPDVGSRHSRGAAVDCTLVTLDGEELEMPTAFDDFTHRAHREYEGMSEAARQNLSVLETAMTTEGFVPLAKEWWHFDSPDPERYPLRDIPLL